MPETSSVAHASARNPSGNGAAMGRNVMRVSCVGAGASGDQVDAVADQIPSTRSHRRDYPRAPASCVIATGCGQNCSLSHIAAYRAVWARTQRVAARNAWRETQCMHASLDAQTFQRQGPSLRQPGHLLSGSPAPARHRMRHDVAVVQAELRRMRGYLSARTVVDYGESQGS
jgi:hypothetical protein